MNSDLKKKCVVVSAFSTDDRIRIHNGTKDEGLKRDENENLKRKRL